MKYLPLLFSILLLLITGCSPSSEDVYKEAKAAYDQKNFPVALEKYAQVVEKDQQSAIAESSQYRIALIYNNDLRELDKAAHAYRRFTELFPESKDAPTCLFLAGFIYNNDMRKHDSAKVIYEEFIQKYPSHELVKSAKFELETMGTDPFQILKTDSAKEVASQSGQKATK